MQLSDLADVSLGTILTRIRPSTQYDDIVETPIISMQELSFASGANLGSDPSVTCVPILSSKQEDCLFTKLSDVVYGLTSLKAMLISEPYVQRLVPSNFALVRSKDKKVLDPAYLDWYLNESVPGKSLSLTMVQGSANVRGITINALRELKMDHLPPMDIQINIGHLYLLMLEKAKINKKITTLQSTVIFQLLNNINKGV